MRKKFILHLICVAIFLGGVVLIDKQDIYAKTLLEKFYELPEESLFKTAYGSEKYSGIGVPLYEINEKNFSLTTGNVKSERVGFVNKDDNKEGYIDTKGNIVIEPKFEKVTDFDDGVAAVKIDGKWGVIDVNGKYIVEPKYDDAYYFNEGLLSCKLGDKWGVIDKNGKVIIPFEYTELKVPSEGLIGYRDSRWGFINTLNEIVIPAKYQDVDMFSEGMAAYKSSGNWGFINKKGEEVINAQYTKVGYFSEGKVSVSKGSKYGVIDKKGNQVIPMEYEYIGDFKDGKAIVKKTRYVLFHQTPGSAPTASTITELDAKYGSFEDITKYHIVFPSGLVGSAYLLIKDEPLVYDGRVGGMKYFYGYIDENNNEVLPCIYTFATDFSNGVAAVQEAPGTSNIVFINEKGEKVDDIKISMEYSDKATEFSEGYSVLSLNSEQGFRIEIVKNPNYTGEEKKEYEEYEDEEEHNLIFYPRNGEEPLKYNINDYHITRIEIHKYGGVFEKEGKLFLGWVASSESSDTGDYIYEGFTYIGLPSSFKGIYADKDILGYIEIDRVEGIEDFFYVNSEKFEDYYYNRAVRKFFERLSNLIPMSYDGKEEPGGFPNINILEDNEWLLKTYDMDNDNKLSDNDYNLLLSNKNDEYFENKEKNK